MNLPHLFIGSASETEAIATKIGKALKDRVQVHHWRDSFGLGEFSLKALQREAAECDFAVFVWGEEDTTVARGERHGAPRDNVVYEAGLFAGALGEHRVFVAHAKNTKIPSDYLGVTTARFDPRKPDIRGIVKQICVPIKQLGGKPATRLSGWWWQLVVTEDDKSVVSFFEVKPKEDGHSVSMGGHAWGESGKLLARWDAIATQFDEGTKTLHYSWEGEHPTEPGVPLYFGVGKIYYGLSPVTGEFSTTRRHQGDNLEPSRFKSAFYIPAQPGHVAIMRDGDANAWKQLIAKMLKRRDELRSAPSRSQYRTRSRRGQPSRRPRVRL